MQEQWIKWEPLQGLSEKYYIDCIVDSIEDFSVLLSDYNNEKKIKIIFKNSVDAYRSTDESYRLKTINDLDKEHGLDFYVKWSFFKVLNSDYIKWLSQESFKISDYSSFTHFSIVAADSILDIVTNYEPRIEFINLDNRQ